MDEARTKYGGAIITDLIGSVGIGWTSSVRKMEQ